MKKLCICFTLALLAVCSQVSLAQQTSIPRIISYQGVVKNAENLPVNGNHKVSIAFYSDTGATQMIWQGTYNILIDGGVFNVLLGSGSYPLPDAKAMNRTLYVGVRLDGGTEMRPLSLMAASPYSLEVADSSITSEKIAADYVGSISVNGKKITGSGTALNLTSGIGTILTYNDTTNNLSINSLGGFGGNAKPQTVLSNPCFNNSDSNISSNVVAGGCADSALSLLGYSAVLGGNSNYVSAPYSSVVGGLRNRDTLDYGFIGGGSDNFNSAEWGVIGGGEFDTLSLLSDYPFIGGGLNNHIATASDGAVIGGGEYNAVNSASGATIAGGYLDTIDADGGAIGGGAHNYVGGLVASIGGGILNSIRNPADYGVIGGGDSNTIYQALDAVVAGGKGNSIVGSNSLSPTPYYGSYSAISGGVNNLINGEYSAIGGGRNLTLGVSSFGFNAGNLPTDVSTDTNLAYFGDVDLWVGNDDNKARQVRFYEPSSSGLNFSSFQARSQIGSIQYILPSRVPTSVTQVLTADSIYTIGPDQAVNLGWSDGLAADTINWKLTGNSGTSTAVNFLGTTDDQAFEIHVYDTDGSHRGSKRVMRFDPNPTSANITGGYQGNLIDSMAIGSVISGGGYANHINQIAAKPDGSFYNEYAFIGGGDSNIIHQDSDLDTDEPVAYGNVIVGGHANQEYDLDNFIGGGEHNTIFEGHSTIVGGTRNFINSDSAIICAGDTNSITQESQYAFIGAGFHNHISPGPSSVIVGGDSNTLSGGYNTIGGGWHNNILHDYSTIAGGQQNNIRERDCFIGGGDSNVITQAYSTIGGGQRNVINDAYSFIGGGRGNRINNNGLAPTTANIPGGDSLIAQNYAQTVVGYYNKSQGMSTDIVPASGRNTIIDSDRVFIVGNGNYNFDSSRYIRSNAFEVSNDGHSIVYGQTRDTARFALVGATYQDNTTIAWGEIEKNVGHPIGDNYFGVDPIHTAWDNTINQDYDVYLDYRDPYTGAQVQILHGIATITPEWANDDTCIIGYATPVQFIGGVNKFHVHFVNPSFNCVTPFKHQFMFEVYGRPKKN